jgi:ABC-2 type transport system permease protein
MMLSNLVRLPVIFISGVFVPVSNLPGWGQIISRLSPVTYITDLMRFGFGQSHFFTVKIDYILLTIFTFLFILMSVYFHKRTMVKRI